MGSVRFTIYGLLKVAKHKVYRGTISYVLTDWPERKPTTVQVPIHPIDSDESDWAGNSLETPAPVILGRLRQGISRDEIVNLYASLPEYLPTSEYQLPNGDLYSKIVTSLEVTTDKLMPTS